MPPAGTINRFRLAATMKSPNCPGSFNQMAESIQQKMQELSANESEYRALFEQAAIGIGHVRLTDYGWSRVNSGLAHILGCDEASSARAAVHVRLFQPEDLPVVERARIQLDDGTLDMFEGCNCTVPRWRHDLGSRHGVASP